MVILMMALGLFSKELKKVYYMPMQWGCMVLLFNEWTLDL